MTSSLALGAWARLGLLACSALVLSVSCDSDDDKRRDQTEDGGEGGADPAAAGAGASTGGSASGGEPNVPLGGAAGTPGAPFGGAAGEPGAPLGGAAGEANAAGAPSAGAGGEPAVLACTPTGSVTSFALDHESIYSVCRGARLGLPYDAASSDASFSCCGVSTSKPALALDLLGVASQDSEVHGGELSLQVPSNAPVGSLFVNVTCNGTDTENVLALEVKDTAAPVVTGVTASVTVGSPITVTGTNLAAVTYVGGASTGGVEYPCVIDPQDHTDTSITCTFATSTPAPETYKLIVYQNDCGYALNSPSFQIVKGK